MIHHLYLNIWVLAEEIFQAGLLDIRKSSNIHWLKIPGPAWNMDLVTVPYILVPLFLLVLGSRIVQFCLCILNCS